MATTTKPDSALHGTPVEELKQRSVRGGLVSVVSQAGLFFLQMGATAVLARILSPEDFGLQGMVFVIVGFLNLFRDAGLGVASIQRPVLTTEQISTMFWVNVAVGAVLTGAAIAMAPFLADFYNDPRLLLMTIASAPIFLVNALAIQHRALMSRAMRFATMAKIDTLALAVSATVGVSMALLDFGYWSLVGMAVSSPLVASAAAWIAMPWIPGRPTRAAGVDSMLRIGGTLTVNSLVVYLAYNTEKVLLGRFWGAEALGLYGRAYQLARLPVEQLNGALSAVAFPALARVQNDPEHLRRSFLKGYSVVISITLPVIIMCALFAEEIVRVLLGPKWPTAAPVLRFLTPAILVLAVINPFGWFLQATGRVVRSLNLAFLIAPVVILGTVAGLAHGPIGVAIGNSIAMLSLMVPVVVWAKHGTGMTNRHYWDSVKQPVAAGAAAGLAGLAFKVACASVLSTVPMLAVGVALLFATYAWFLLIVMGQKTLYADLLRQVVGTRGR